MQLAAQRDFRLHLLRSLHRPAEPPTCVVVGPEAGTSGLFYALFAHLAGHAQYANPGEGGTVLDETYPELSAMLGLGGDPPAWSSTCRLGRPSDVRLGSATGVRRMRFLHLRLPPDGMLDPLCMRALQRAQILCVVMPAGMSEAEADRWCAGLLACAGVGARSVMLVRDGEDAAGPLAKMPETGRVLADRPAQCLALPLGALRDRYLRGEVSPGEAAALVRRLLSSEDAPVFGEGGVVVSEEGMPAPGVGASLPPGEAGSVLAPAGAPAPDRCGDRSLPGLGHPGRVRPRGERSP